MRDHYCESRGAEQLQGEHGFTCPEKFVFLYSFLCLSCICFLVCLHPSVLDAAFCRSDKGSCIHDIVAVVMYCMSVL